MFLADFSTPAQLAAALERIRADADAILDVGQVVANEYIDGTAPFQDQIHVRALVFDFLSHHALMLHEWADRTERAIGEWDRMSTGTRERAAQTSIRTTLERYPEHRV